jgi:hypothetical protein
MEEIKIIGVFFLCVSVWMVFEIWRAPTYDEKSNGKYITTCAADDYWHNNDKLELQVNYMEECPRRTLK